MNPTFSIIILPCNANLNEMLTLPFYSLVSNDGLSNLIFKKKDGKPEIDDEATSRLQGMLFPQHIPCSVVTDHPLPHRTTEINLSDSPLHPYVTDTMETQVPHISQRTIPFLIPFAASLT